MKQYIDATQHACVAIFATDEEGKQIEIVQAGTTIYSMPIKDRKEYLTLEEKMEYFLSLTIAYLKLIFMLFRGLIFLQDIIMTDTWEQSVA